jgi:hypothetical protein
MLFSSRIFFLISLSNLFSSRNYYKLVVLSWIIFFSYFFLFSFCFSPFWEKALMLIFNLYFEFKCFLTLYSIFEKHFWDKIAFYHCLLKYFEMFLLCMHLIIFIFLHGFYLSYWNLPQVVADVGSTFLFESRVL